MVRKTVQLGELQCKELERHAIDQGVSFSELVRRSVDLFLRNQPVVDDVRQRAIDAVGYARSPDDDVSVRHDDYLVDAYRR